MSEKIAVVGAGMFGITAAVDLANEGHTVSIYERNNDILKSASGSNQWRLHRGYHYPKSDETAEATLKTEPLFRERYQPAVIDDEEHYYSIAEDSQVSYEDYVDFMNKHGLEHEPVDLDLVNSERIEQTIRVNENHVNVKALREICHNELNESGVIKNLNTEVTSLGELDDYDRLIIATYAASNSLLPAGHELRRQFRFELCEVPVVRLPEEYTGNNIIVVYGPFMSVDHWGASDLFVMGDYHHMRHHSNVGHKPEIPTEYRDLVNTGLVENPSVSNFRGFQNNGQKYIPGVKTAEHVGSLFTIRTILPSVSETDARPTLVNQSGNIISILGGKLATSVDTAQRVVSIVRSE